MYTPFFLHMFPVDSGCQTPRTPDVLSPAVESQVWTAHGYHQEPGDTIRCVNEVVLAHWFPINANPVQSLQYFSGCQIELIQNYPVAIPHSFYQHPWKKWKKWIITTKPSNIPPTARNSKQSYQPSWKTSCPLELAVYMPTYSWRSVCSWLFILRHLWPVTVARYWTRLVLPAEVGPWRSAGYFLKQAWEFNYNTRIEINLLAYDMLSIYKTKNSLACVHHNIYNQPCWYNSSKILQVLLHTADKDITTSHVSLFLSTVQPKSFHLHSSLSTLRWWSTDTCSHTAVGNTQCLQDGGHDQLVVVLAQLREEGHTEPLHYTIFIC